MTRTDRHSTSIPSADQSAADVLVVGVDPAAIRDVPTDSLMRADSGRDVLQALKLLRFRLLLASLDLPDMPTWELFSRARRSQSRLQCALVDDRLTLDDERRIRQAGAAVFAANDPALSESIARLIPLASRLRVFSESVPQRAPP